MSLQQKTVLGLLLTVALVTGYALSYLMVTYPQFFGLIPLKEWTSTQRALIGIGLPIPVIVWAIGIYKIVTR